MISPTESQNRLAANDPSSFQCALSLSPQATPRKKKRSYKPIPKLNLGSSALTLTINGFPSAPLPQSLNVRVLNQNLLVTGYENMVAKRQHMMGFLDNAVLGHNEVQGCPEHVLPSTESLQDLFSVQLTNVVGRLEGLRISDAGSQLVVQNQNAHGKVEQQKAVIVYKKRKPPPKVDIDQETMRVWKVLMADSGEDVEEERDEDKEKWWEEQRNICRGRVDSFIARMHLVHGDRRFSQWKGSVVDSVVGVFLTQNVSDHLSSSAFMSLTAKYPLRSATEHKACDEDGGIAYSQESVASNIRERIQDEILQQDFLDSLIDDPLTSQKHYAWDISDNLGCMESFGRDAVIQKKPTPRAQEATVELCASFSKCHELLECISQEEVNKAKGQELGKNYREDSWEEVRQATIDEVADAIKGRGQHRVLVERIKDFLDRVVRDHGSINLEWLRSVPPDKAKEYLLSFKELGLKSVECVRLLTLQHHAFPVDTNVGRVAVRLGWVPLKPLPESLQIHLLELHELHYQMITFGKAVSSPIDYVKASLLSQFGFYDVINSLSDKMVIQVFCRKCKPNCNACPTRGQCRHSASAFASTRLALPGPQAATSIVPYEAVQDSSLVITPANKSFPAATFSESRYETKSCEPIIEHPPSPEPEHESIEYLERDIEDLFNDPEDYIPAIRLDVEEFKERIQEFIDMSNIPLEGVDMSKALVALTSKAASIPLPKLKDISWLRTIHYVYELPDSHRILAGVPNEHGKHDLKSLKSTSLNMSSYEEHS
ncbi:hypothetical protein Vadar_014774 [Vaccinium darrowii]|uniref:Uncharacterized protein n=1 Tax=Vaccinium darrowii TaxID=229202 RepID=A0ACB7XQT7_9ERIC|nr:hypothetical protein Vadar_014774 [Vaccinium darrowii]